MMTTATMTTDPEWALVLSPIERRVVVGPVIGEADDDAIYVNLGDDRPYLRISKGHTMTHGLSEAEARHRLAVLRGEDG